MDICDFAFRGEKLSDHGYMLCEFDSSSLSTATTDSQRTFTSISMFGGKYQPFLYYTYGDTLIMTMSICKIDDSTDYVITPLEAANLKRWLCSPTPQEFRLGGDDYSSYYWRGSFNVEEMHLGGDRVGFALTFTADAPFGYMNDRTLTGNATKNGTVTVNDTSDEEGYIYPDLSVTLNAGGTLTITNSFDGRETVISNCVSGETITFSRYLQASSSKESHELGDDFNYKFVRISNKYGNAVNKLTFSLPCSYTITYTPIAKVVIA